MGEVATIAPGSYLAGKQIVDWWVPYLSKYYYIFFYVLILSTVFFYSLSLLIGEFFVEIIIPTILFSVIFVTILFGWDYGFDSVQRKPILISKHYLIYDRYERKSHIYYHKKIKLSISEITHFEVNNLPQEIQAKIKGRVGLDDLAIITISLNGGEIMHLIRYDSIISNLEDSLRSLNKSNDGHLSESDPTDKNKDIRSSFSNSFNFSAEKNSIFVVTIFLIILGIILMSTAYSNGSFGLLLFTTVFSTSLITLGIVYYSDYTIRMPQQITITNNGLEIRFKRNKMKQVDWSEVIGVSDLNEGKFSELALNIGRPYMISLEISKNISKFFKMKYGYNLPCFGKYGALSDLRDLRKNKKILDRK